MAFVLRILRFHTQFYHLIFYNITTARCRFVAIQTGFTSRYEHPREQTYSTTK